MQTTAQAQTPYTRVMYHAILRDVHGWALRTEQGQCFFYGDEGTMQELRNEDAADMIWLGRVDLAAAARADDEASLAAQMVARLHTPRTLITGRTFPVRAALKALGGVWDAYQQGWLVPNTHADEARALVARAQTA